MILVQLYLKISVREKDIVCHNKGIVNFYQMPYN